MNADINLIEVACPVCAQSSEDVVATGYDFEYGTTQNELPLRYCKICDLIYLSSRPDPSELSRIYPPEYNPFQFHEIRNPIVRWGRRFIQKKKALAIRKLLGDNATLIDVGCGSGSFIALLKGIAPPGWRLVGNDFSDEVLQPVKELGIETISGCFEDIALDYNFDLIILNQTIEHFDNPSAVVKKAFRLLNPEGKFFIETPCIQGLDARLFRSRYWGGYHIPRHWTLFSSSSIETLLRQHGFCRVEIQYLTSPSFWIQSFHHYFLDKGYPQWWNKFWVFRNPALLSIFVLLDLSTGFFGLPTSNMRVVAWKD